MDFTVSDKMKTITGMINEFVDKELIPLEHEFLIKDFTLLEPILEEKRNMVKQMELWAPNQSKEYGGMGLTWWSMGWCQRLWAEPLWGIMFLTARRRMQATWRSCTCSGQKNRRRSTCYRLSKARYAVAFP